VEWSARAWARSSRCGNAQAHVRGSIGEAVGDGAGVELRARGAAARWLSADPHGESIGAVREGRWRPLRRKPWSEGSGRAWRAWRSCGAARHDELPSSIRKSRREQRDASLTCNVWPTSFFVNHGNLVIVKLILSSPILFTAGIYFPRILLHNQGYPKVCPDSLNLLNAGDSFTGISPLTSCYLFSPTRDLIAMF
jgi:hypothetical protein